MELLGIKGLRYPVPWSHSAQLIISAACSDPRSSQGYSSVVPRAQGSRFEETGLLVGREVGVRPRVGHLVQDRPAGHPRDTGSADGDRAVSVGPQIPSAVTLTGLKQDRERWKCLAISGEASEGPYCRRSLRGASSDDHGARVVVGPSRASWRQPYRAGPSWSTSSPTRLALPSPDQSGPGPCSSAEARLSCESTRDIGANLSSARLVRVAGHSANGTAALVRWTAISRDKTHRPVGACTPYEARRISEASETG